jgi:hypothetical protein
MPCLLDARLIVAAHKMMDVGNNPVPGSRRIIDGQCKVMNDISFRQLEPEKELPFIDRKPLFRAFDGETVEEVVDSRDRSNGQFTT